MARPEALPENPPKENCLLALPSKENVELGDPIGESR